MSNYRYSTGAKRPR